MKTRLIISLIIQLIYTQSNSQEIIQSIKKLDVEGEILQFLDNGNLISYQLLPDKKDSIQLSEYDSNFNRIWSEIFAGRFRYTQVVKSSNQDYLIVSRKSVCRFNPDEGKKWTLSFPENQFENSPYPTNVIDLDSAILVSYSDSWTDTTNASNWITRYERGVLKLTPQGEVTQKIVLSNKGDYHNFKLFGSNLIDCKTDFSDSTSMIRMSEYDLHLNPLKTFVFGGSGEEELVNFHKSDSGYYFLAKTNSIDGNLEGINHDSLNSKTWYCELSNNFEITHSKIVDIPTNTNDIKTYWNVNSQALLTIIHTQEYTSLGFGNQDINISLYDHDFKQFGYLKIGGAEHEFILNDLKTDSKIKLNILTKSENGDFEGTGSGNKKIIAALDFENIPQEKPEIIFTSDTIHIWDKFKFGDTLNILSGTVAQDKIPQYSFWNRSDTIWSHNQPQFPWILTEEGYLLSKIEGDFPELQGSHEHTIYLGDGILFDLRPIVINVNEFNDPPFLVNRELHFAENAKEMTIIGEIELSDPENNEIRINNIRYNEDVFLVNENIILLLDSTKIDFETGRNSFEIIIEFEDYEHIITDTLNIIVDDFNIPPSMDNHLFLIRENPGNEEIIGRLIGSDQDQDSTELKFFINEGFEYPQFDLLENGSLKVKDPEYFNYESDQIFYFEVTCWDGFEADMAYVFVIIQDSLETQSLSTSINQDLFIGGKGIDFVVSSSKLDDGTKIILGNTNSQNIDKIDVVDTRFKLILAHLSEKNELLFYQDYGDITKSCFGSAVIKTKSNNFLILSDENSYSTSTDDYVSNRVAIYSTDLNGKEKWKTLYPIKESTDTLYSHDIKEVNEGFLVLLSETEKNRKYDIKLVKFDLHGNISWERTYGGSENDFGHKVILCQNEDILILGTTSSQDGHVSEWFNYQDIWVVRISPSGDIVFETTLGGFGSDFPGDVVENANGDFIIVGTSYSYDGYVLGQHGQGDGVIFSIDKYGEFNWSRTYGGSKYDEMNSLIQNESGYMIVGSTESHDGSINSEPVFLDYWVAQLDYEGHNIWTHVPRIEEDQIGSNIIAEADGSYTLIGTSFNFHERNTLLENQIGGFTMNLLNFASTGTLSTNIKPHKKNVTIYPNPALDKIEVVVEGEINFLKIIDQTGAVVLNSRGDEKSINIEGLTSGIYYVIVESGFGIKVEKLIKK